MVTLSREQCLIRLAQTAVGRIGVSIDALPVILPIHFTMVDGSVLFRTMKGTKLDMAAGGAVVAFQVDSPDSGGGGWWSVLVQGIASPVGDETHAHRSSAASWNWSGAGDASRLLRIDPSAMSGRLFEGAGLRLPGCTN